MSKAKTNLRRSLAVIFAAAGLLAAVMPLLAADVTTSSTQATQSAVRLESAQVVLIRRLAARGAISQEDAIELIKLAEADAADARVQAALTALATAQADAARARAEAVATQASAVKNSSDTNIQSVPISTPAAPVVRTATPGLVSNKPVESVPEPSGPVVFNPVVAAKTASPGVDAALTPTANHAGDEDVVRVTYVPETVKAQLRQEIKDEVLEQAKQEHWAAPRAFPDWVSRISFYGDFRFRYEGIYNHKQSNADGVFPNFNVINTGSPFDTTGSANSPQYNVDQDRSRIRLRARLGVAVDLGEGFTANLRFATGESNSPVSQNQTLGAAGSGQGGDFSKYALWLDRAYLRYQSEADTARAVTITLGRFENPFISTSIIWADDLGFDGAAVMLPAQIHYDGLIVDTIKPYFVFGVFPIFNTDLNYSTNQNSKYSSNDKWLEAGQFGLNLNLGRDLKAKLGVAYYYFTKTVGKLSTPFTPLTTSDAGDTDARRPSFAQRGNTYMELRSIIADSTNSYGYSNQWQYYGLATTFRDLAYDLRLDYNHFEPFQVSFISEYIRNLGFNPAKIIARSPVNNLGSAADDLLASCTAWIAGFRVGNAILQQRWDWSVTASYRSVGSDSVIDGFCDSDFGGGGTNLRGTTLGATVALSKRVQVGAKWMSATQVDGPTYKNDIIQIDLNAKF